MGDRADIVRYRLYSLEKGYMDIPEPVNYDEGNKDVIERNRDSKQFEFSKSGAIELYGDSFNYIVSLQAVYGIIPDLRLIESRKDELRLDQRWKVVSDVGLDLGTTDFDYSKKTVKIQSQKGGLMQIIDARFDDEYDVNEGIERISVRLDSRKIFRRSRLFVDDGEEVFAVVSGNDGLNARAIPFKIDYSSDQENIQNVIDRNLNANNGNYTNALNVGTLFFLVADRDKTIKLNGTVNTRITVRNLGSFSLDLIRFKTDDLLFEEVIERLDTCNPFIIGDICSYNFIDYEIQLKKGDSLAISTLSDTVDGIRYEVFNTAVIIEEDSTYPVTYTDSVKVSVLMERLLLEATEKENVFYSELFGIGGKYENLLITHGTWLRNMPRIINEGKDDERIIQANLSLKKLIEGLNLPEPLMYGTKKIENKETFYLEKEKDSQRNFISIRLGETRDQFTLMPVDKEIRKVIPNNFYSSINIGSTKTGSDYGEVNNLYSICGNAKWNTINNTKKSEYKATSDFRTGSVDVELTRQKQYYENPDLDSDYDNDWFLLDCKFNGVEFELKKWQDFYDEIPTNVYDAESEYNWSFTPYELLLGHGWKINSGLQHYTAKALKFISSNCASNLITDNFQHDQPIPHTILQKPTYNNMSINFNLQVNQEIAQLLRGQTNGIDNKFGLVEFLSDGFIQYGRLIKVDENKEGKFELIEAYV